MADGEEVSSCIRSSFDYSLSGVKAERQILNQICLEPSTFVSQLDQLKSKIDLFNKSSLVIHNFTVRTRDDHSMTALCDSGAPIGAISEEAFGKHFPGISTLRLDALTRTFAGIGADSTIRGKVAIIPIFVGRRREQKDIMVIVTSAMRGNNSMLIGADAFKRNDHFTFQMSSEGGFVQVKYDKLRTFPGSRPPAQLVASADAVIHPGKTMMIPLRLTGDMKARQEMFIPMELPETLVHRESCKIFKQFVDDGKVLALIKNIGGSEVVLYKDTIMFEMNERVPETNYETTRINYMSEDMGKIRQECPDILDSAACMARATLVAKQLKSLKSKDIPEVVIKMMQAAEVPSKPPEEEASVLGTEWFAPVPEEIDDEVTKSFQEGSDFPMPEKTEPVELSDLEFILIQKPFAWKGERGSLMKEEPEVFTEMIALLLTMRDKGVFYEEGQKLKAVRGVTVDLKPKDGAHPVADGLRKFSLTEVREISKQLAAMIDLGVVKMNQMAGSPWSSSIVLVRRHIPGKEVQYRLCLDLRAVNERVQVVAVQSPSLDRCLNMFNKTHKIFSSLDLKKAYWELLLSDRASKILSFRAPYSDPDNPPNIAMAGVQKSFSMKRMPFGLCHAGTIFSKLMSEVLDGLPVEAYLDDIPIASVSAKDHLKQISQVASRLVAFNLTLGDKNRWFAESLDFLGYHVTREGIIPQVNKVKAIQTMRHPRTKKEVRMWLGMVIFYARFVDHLAELLLPITNLLKDATKFHWDEQCTVAFKAVGDVLSSAPVLQHVDWEKPFVLQTDASDYAIGASLMQKNKDGELRPVSYYSKKLSGPQLNWSTTAKELYSVMAAIAKFRVFLWGYPFKLQTDHSALQWLLKSKTATSGKLYRWALSLSEYQFTVEHIPGKDLQGPDTLSRLHRLIGSVMESVDDKGRDIVDNTETETWLRLSLDGVELVRTEIAHMMLPITEKNSIAATFQEQLTKFQTAPKLEKKDEVMVPAAFIQHEVSNLDKSPFRLATVVGPAQGRGNKSGWIQVVFCSTPEYPDNPTVDIRTDWAIPISLWRQKMNTARRTATLEMHEISRPQIIASRSNPLAVFEVLTVAPGGLIVMRDRFGHGKVHGCFAAEVVPVQNSVQEPVGALGKRITVKSHVKVSHEEKYSIWSKLKAIDPLLVPAEPLSWHGVGQVVSRSHGKARVLFNEHEPERSTVEVSMGWLRKTKKSALHFTPAPIADPGPRKEATPERVSRTSEPENRSSLPHSFDSMMAKNFTNEYLKDPHLHPLYSYVKTKSFPRSATSEQKSRVRRQHKDYIIQDNKLFKVDALMATKQLVIPRGMVNTVLVTFHDEFGHQGAEKVLPLIRAKFTWHMLDKSVRMYCKACVPCQKRRAGKFWQSYYNRPLGSLRASNIGDLWSTDLVSLPKTLEGHCYALVCTEHFSRFTVIVPLKNKLAVTVAAAFYDEVILKFGVPYTILSDQGSEFCSKVYSNICKWTGAAKLLVSVGNPSGNGLLERFNRVIVNCLIKYQIQTGAEDWVPKILALAFQHNVSFSSVISGVPFEAFFGRAAVMNSDLKFGTDKAEYFKSVGGIVGANIAAMSEAHEIIRKATRVLESEYLEFQATASYKREYNTGDWVLIRHGKRVNSKASKFVGHSGPFEVVTRVSEQSYVIKGADGVPAWMSTYRLIPCIMTETNMGGLAPTAAGPDMRMVTKLETKKIRDLWSPHKEAEE